MDLHFGDITKLNTCYKYIYDFITNCKEHVTNVAAYDWTKASQLCHVSSQLLTFSYFLDYVFACFFVASWLNLITHILMHPITRELV